ncbi:putative sister chromatid cohesion protein ctf8 [Golovinomyces cichoracearum]|uniref:Putative sister chromatid cohesion protein ctf8 n=1 Tax=Golovinomyces cichoracearum TaxID=62708 RepID=A0A420IAC8_9PEZI|nr:putative sister chromatid cohesion protein ctf8 [Golovinomyces cichoracearum]
MSQIITLTHAQAPEPIKSPLPQLLKTPSGLAILELQGTINLPAPNCTSDIELRENHQLLRSHTENSTGLRSVEAAFGRLSFPYHDEGDTNSTAWMKKVFLYVGPHQRLTGEVKKLQNALAVIRKVKDELMEEREDVDNTAKNEVQLEIVDIIKYKILFTNRPEPVGIPGDFPAADSPQK